MVRSRPISSRPSSCRRAARRRARADGRRAEAEALGDRLLQALDLLVAEFDHLAGAEIDQVIVVDVGNRLVAAAALAEIVAGDDAGILEELDRAVDGGDRDPRIDRRGAPIEFLDVGMIGRRVENTGDDPALLGHAQALGAQASSRLLVLLSPATSQGSSTGRLAKLQPHDKRGPGRTVKAMIVALSLADGLETERPVKATAARLSRSTSRKQDSTRSR